jgi:hypothetical protein
MQFDGPKELFMGGKDKYNILHIGKNPIGNNDVELFTNEDKEKLFSLIPWRLI